MISCGSLNLLLKFKLAQDKEIRTHTLISFMDASVSAEMDVSPLPLREDVPPREVRVAPETVDAREDP